MFYIDYFSTSEIQIIDSVRLIDIEFSISIIDSSLLQLATSVCVLYRVSLEGAAVSSICVIVVRMGVCRLDYRSKDVSTKMKRASWRWRLVFHSVKVCYNSENLRMSLIF